MLGQVREPQLNRASGGEVTTDQVIVRRGPDLALIAAILLREHAPPAVVGADLPHRPITDLVAGVSDLVEEEPVSELGVVAMRVVERVRQIRLA